MADDAEPMGVYMSDVRHPATDATSPRARARHRVLPAALAALAAALVPGLTALPAHANGSGTLLLQDDFKDSSVASTAYLAGGTFATCLTASTATSGTPIPGCATTAIDTSGSGALRLTNAATGKSGYLLYDKALPTKAGLDITFDQYQYSGSGADGISFFLTDGSYSLSAPGAAGGSLGYHNNSSTDGVAHALLGVGFDVFGNFTVETNNTSCGTSDDAYISGEATDHKSSVAVRGPGNGKTDYCLLGSPVSTLDSTAAVDLHSDSFNRPAAIVTRIVIDPPSVSSPKVTVYLNGAQVTQVAEPSVLATTPTFKFGWAASTGGSTDIHEINFLLVQSVNPILPDLSLAAPTAATVASGQTASLTWTPQTSAAAGPVPANEMITFSATAPSGTTFSAASGTGWTCTGTGTAALSCTRSSPTAVDPGTTLPTVTTTLTRSTAGSSGSGTVNGSITSSSDDSNLTADNSQSATVAWAPVAHDVSGTAVSASTTPATTPISPSVTGSGPYTYAVSGVSGPGTVTYDSTSGTFHVTPTAGASGLVSASYTATDAGGTSSAATIQLDVTPVAVSSTATATSGQPLVTTLPDPLGTGAFTAAGTTPGSGLDSAVVTMVSGHPQLRVTPTAGFSGTTTVTYKVQDAVSTSGHTRMTSGVVTLTVLPLASDGSGETTLDALGDATLSATLPTPSGTGSFSYALVSGGGLGSAVSVSTSGVVTVDETSGASGVFPVTYTVTGAGGTSASATYTVTVHPYVSQVPVADGTADATTTSVAPTFVGTGTPTWAVSGVPAGTTASVDTAGRVTLDTHGASGTFTVTSTGTANGVSSSRVVTFDVQPVAHAVSGTATAAGTPTATTLTPATPTGTGPYTLSTVTTPAVGASSVSVSGGNLLVTPAAGFSGTLQGTYQVTDAAGLTSAPVDYTLVVSPTQADSPASVDSGTTTDVALPTPVGTGPFSYALTSGPAVGTATVGPDGLHLTVPGDYSGPLQISYTVTDANGLVSTPATVSVTVDPTVTSSSATTTAVPVGGTPAPVTGPKPSPSGTGPFTAYQIVAGPDTAAGTATIDPDTGVVTFTPAPGWSGSATVTYRAQDGNGAWTAPQKVTFTVAPVTSTGPSTGTPTVATVTSGGTVTTSLPAPVGTGPFTYVLVTAPGTTQASTTLDASTGALRVAAAPGVSGRLRVGYAVRDAAGTLSATSTVEVDVLPVAVAATTVVPHQATRTYQLPTPAGTGPFTWALTTTPSAAQGVATVDPQTGLVTFTAAAGYAGSVVLAYTVTDADGLTSAPAELTAQVLAAGLAATGAELASTTGLALTLVVLGVLLTRLRRRARSAVR